MKNGRGWAIVAYVALLQVFTYGMAGYAVGVSIIPWATTFGTPRADLLLIPVIGQLAGAVISPFAGAWMDRLPLRHCIFGGLVAFTTGLAIISQATASWVLIAVYGSLIPLATMFAGPLVAQIAIAKWFTESRGLAFAIAAAGGGAGGLLLPPVVAMGIEAYGWRSTYLVIALTAFVILAPLAFVVKQPPTPQPRTTSLERGLVNPPLTTLDVAKDGTFWAIMLALVAIVAVQVTLQFNLPTIAHDRGISPTNGALLISILAGSSIASKPVWGYAIDRTSTRTIYLTVAFLYLFTCGILLKAFGECTFLHFSVAAIMSGFAAGAIQSLLGVVLVERFGALNFGKVRGLAGPILTLSAIGPASVAWAYKRTGSYELAI